MPLFPSNGFEVPTLIKTTFENSDCLLLIDNSGTLCKITKADLLAGLSSSDGVTDTLFSSILFGSHFETLTDIKGHQITGSATISTIKKYFGTSSLYCDGTTSSYIEVVGNDFNIASNESFTFDTFLNFASTGSAYSFFPFLELGNPDSNGMRVGWFNNAGGRIQLVLLGSAYYFDWLPSVNTWYYFSLERDSSLIQVKVDGVQIGSSLINTSAITTTSMRIGGSILDPSQRMIGYFDDTRFTKAYRGITSSPAQTF